MPSVPSAAPKLVNRGPAGLLTKLPSAANSDKKQQPEIPPAPINKIAPSLKGLEIEISSLSLDPDNARLHPERNMEAIKQSLQMYGQVKPVVVRADKRIVVAGNGTMEAAIQLGWTRIAASIVEMDDITAAGYGLADNRCAELAKWDFEVVARLDKLLLEAGHASIGWSLDELEVLRAADWTPPPIADDEQDSSEAETLVISFTPDQYVAVGKALAVVRQVYPQYDQAQLLEWICQQWLDSVTEDASDAANS